MGREWPYDRRMSERQKIEFRAYARSPEELAVINEFLREYQQCVDEIERYEREVKEAERRKREAIDKQFKELYGLLPYEQYRVLSKANVDKKSREQIREETGKSPAALRQIIHDAKQNIKRRGLWDKFANLFDF